MEGTREGLASARASGVRLGRPPAMTAEQVRHARALLSQPDNTVSAIARLLGVSRSTIYKYVPELGGARGGASEVSAGSDDRASALDTVLSALPQDTRPALPDVSKYDDLLPSHSTATNPTEPWRDEHAEPGNPQPPPAPTDPELRFRRTARVEPRPGAWHESEAAAPSKCPTCGHEPADVGRRMIQRRDLAMAWLHPDP